jgi:hypothetical protein
MHRMQVNGTMVQLLRNCLAWPAGTMVARSALLLLRCSCYSAAVLQLHSTSCSMFQMCSTTTTVPGIHQCCHAAIRDGMLKISHHQFGPVRPVLQMGCACQCCKNSSDSSSMHSA